MTYRFKSRATGDLIMLEADGRRLLQIIGKDPGPTGIILPGQMAAAVQALQEAIANEEGERGAAVADAKTRDAIEPAVPEVPLRQRATPLLDMLARCGKDGEEIVWGV